MEQGSKVDSSWSAWTTSDLHGNRWRLQRSKPNSDGELAGIYYDNPEFVPEDSLRSFAGVKVSATEGLTAIAAHPGFRLVEVEKGPSLYTEWSGGSGV